jgi:hypothetical protein
MNNYPVELPHGFYHRRVVAVVEPDRVRAAVEDESLLAHFPGTLSVAEMQRMRG